jgi:hypothetical protein
VTRILRDIITLLLSFGSFRAAAIIPRVAPLADRGRFEGKTFL